MRRNPPARRPSVARPGRALAARSSTRLTAPPRPAPDAPLVGRPQQARRRQGRCQGRQGRQGQDRCLSPDCNSRTRRRWRGRLGRSCAARSRCGGGERPHVRRACVGAVRRRLCVDWMLTNAHAQPARVCPRALSRAAPHAPRARGTSRAPHETSRESGGLVRAPRSGRHADPRLGRAGATRSRRRNEPCATPGSVARAPQASPRRPRSPARSPRPSARGRPHPHSRARHVVPSGGVKRRRSRARQSDRPLLPAAPPERTPLSQARDSPKHARQE